MEKGTELAKNSKGEGVPSMWKLSDEDTDVYIFGTFHLLPDGVDWRTEKFDAVVGEMNALYVEADVESPEAMQQLQTAAMQASMFTDGKTLSAAMGDDIVRVGDAFMSLGVPEESVGPMLQQMDVVKPWAIGLNLVQMQIGSFGYNVESGVEKVLLGDAAAREIPVKYLETGAVQIAAISGGSDDEQAKSLKLQLDTMDTSKEQLELLLNEWTDGDEIGLGYLMANPSMNVTEDAYNRMFLDRNTAWIPKIEAILDDPGTKLVAVGAGHMAGPDSVITLLEANGHKVEVVQ